MTEYVVVALFFLSLALRFYFWPAGLFHTDSVIAAEHAERGVADGRVYYLQGRLGYPAYAFLNTGLFYVANRLFGFESAPTPLLLSTMILASLSVVLMYILSCKLTGSKSAGLYSAILLSFMPLHLSLSTYVKDQMFGACAVLAALYFAHKAYKQDFKTKALAVFFLCLAVAIRQQEFLLIPAFLVLFFHGKTFFSLKNSKKGMQIHLSKETGKAVLWSIVVVLSLVAFFILSFVPRMIWEPNYDIWASFARAGGGQFSGQGFSFFSPVFKGYALPWALRNITELGVLLLAYSLYAGYRRDKGVWLSMVSWMVPYFMIVGNFIELSPYFIFQAFIPAAFLMGWGLDDIGTKTQTLFKNKKLEFKKTIIPSILTLAICVWMLWNIVPILSFRSEKCGPCEFAILVSELTPEGALVESADQSRHHEYYGDRTVLGYRPNPFDVEDIENYFNTVDSLIIDEPGFYITTHGTGNDYRLTGLVGISPDDPSLIVNQVTGRQYINIAFVEHMGQPYLVDRQTGLPLPIRGLYTLELFNRYVATPIVTFEDEDWHHNDLDFGHYNNTLYRLQIR
jgi:hypothetical protein